MSFGASRGDHTSGSSSRSPRRWRMLAELLARPVPLEPSLDALAAQLPAALDFMGALLPGGWPALMEQNRADARAQLRERSQRPHTPAKLELLAEPQIARAECARAVAAWRVEHGAR
ncbi:MAG: hypothetical protein ACOY3Y_09620 [Acidobacteriota bacterium]